MQGASAPSQSQKTNYINYPITKIITTEKFQDGCHGVKIGSINRFGGI